jgi:4-diphosphocytidyl-2-C-methyl-D-erythritol kinase
MWTERLAPAKVNLFLHVGPVALDGYHPVCSLMVFADLGDVVRLGEAERMAFSLEGPFAGPLAGETDNLVTRARDRLIDGRDPPPEPFAIVLEKALPIAAGLGGGSADAAATLALVAGWLAAEGQGGALDERIEAIARELGADVAACLASRAVIGRGRGDELTPAPALPTLDAVLVNPLAPSPTGPVYRAYDRMAVEPMADEPAWPRAFAGVGDVAAFLKTTRNDLEAPAASLQPAIGVVLAALASAPEALLARMSGSGATCFALCADRAAAERLAGRLSGDRPDWWVRACRLG